MIRPRRLLVALGATAALSLAPATAAMAAAPTTATSAPDATAIDSQVTALTLTGDAVHGTVTVAPPYDQALIAQLFGVLLFGSPRVVPEPAATDQGAQIDVQATFGPDVAPMKLTWVSQAGTESGWFHVPEGRVEMKPGLGWNFPPGVWVPATPRAMAIVHHYVDGKTPLPQLDVKPASTTSKGRPWALLAAGLAALVVLGVLASRLLRSGRLDVRRPREAEAPVG